MYMTPERDSKGEWRCPNCDHPLLHGEPECPECTCGLDWDDADENDEHEDSETAPEAPATDPEEGQTMTTKTTETAETMKARIVRYSDELVTRGKRKGLPKIEKVGTRKVTITDTRAEPADGTLVRFATATVKGEPAFLVQLDDCAFRVVDEATYNDRILATLPPEQYAIDEAQRKAEAEASAAKPKAKPAAKAKARPKAKPAPAEGKKERAPSVVLPKDERDILDALVLVAVASLEAAPNDATAAAVNENIQGSPTAMKKLPTFQGQIEAGSWCYIRVFDALKRQEKAGKVVAAKDGKRTVYGLAG